MAMIHTQPFVVSFSPTADSTNALLPGKHILILIKPYAIISEHVTIGYIMLASHVIALYTFFTHVVNTVWAFVACVELMGMFFFLANTAGFHRSIFILLNLASFGTPSTVNSR